MVEKASRHASHTGDLHIGDIVIPCAVLDDGTRVISERGITTAVLGTRSGASKRRKRKSRDGGAPRPIFLAPTNLAPFISKELLAGPLNPLAYHVDQLTQGQRLRNLGPRSYIGFEA